MASTEGVTQAVWLKREGGSNNEEALSMDRDAAGNVLYCGYYSAGATIQNQLLSNQGYNDIFLAKVNSLGNSQWVVSAGGILPDRAFACATDVNNNVLLTGYFTESASFGSTTLNAINVSQDVFVAKYSSSGTLQWAMSMGGNLDDAGYGVDTDSQGNIYIAGQFKGTGNFGPYSVSSTVDPVSGTFSYDVFICKISPAGNVLWVKTGAAESDDLIKDICVDNSDNVCVTGYFGATISFDAVYPNSIQNAGFVFKVDSNGNDIWFLPVYSTYLNCENVEVDLNNNVLVSGDYGGQFVLETNQTITVTASFAYNTFLLSLDGSGNFGWFSDEGSDNVVQSKSLDVFDDGTVFMGGLFQCDFTKMNQELGGTLFFSAGYKDIFIMKYDAAGNRLWARQYGGPGDEQCQALSAVGPDQPIISGGFDSWFNIPTAESVSIAGCVFTGNYSPNLGLNYCGFLNYGNYFGLNVIGGRDIFICSPYDVNAPPYDYAAHEGTSECPQAWTPFCFESCVDTLSECTFLTANEYIQVHGEPGSDPQQVIGPTYQAVWSSNVLCQESSSNPSDVFQLCVNNPGWIWMTIEREDGCGVEETDSIYVEFLETPPIPMISDETGALMHSQAPEDFLVLCDTDDVFTVENTQPQFSYVWDDGNTTSTSTTFFVSGDGSATITAIASNGCESNHVIHYDLSNVAPDAANPGTLQLTSNGQPIAADTLHLCSGDPLEVSYIFDDTNDAQQSGVFSYWYSNVDTYFGSLQSDTTIVSTNHIFHVYPSYEGWYTVYGWLNYQANSCDYDMDSLLVFIDIQNAEDMNLSLIGPPNICAGDTVSVQATSAPGTIVTISGPQVLGDLSDDEFETTMPGVYTIIGTLTTSEGCVIQDFENLLIPAVSPPFVFSLPGDGIICPNQTVSLYSPPGGEHAWIGPNGTIVGDQQIIEVDEPGYYYCIYTNADGCALSSNFLELTQLSSPYIVAEPNNYLCTSEPIQIEAISTDQISLNWLPPLSGSSTVQSISTPGYYAVEVELCGVNDTVGIEIFGSPVNSIVNTNAPEFFCSGDTIILLPEDPTATYVWFPDSVIASQWIITEPGFYYADITDTLGCIAQSQIFEINYSTISSPGANPIVICDGSSPVLNAIGEFELVWYSENMDSLFTGSTFYPGAIDEETNFFVLNHVGNCDSDPISVDVSIYPPVLFEITSSVICQGESVGFQIVSDNASSVVWSFGDNLSSSEFFIEHEYADSGIYQVHGDAIDMHGCSSSFTDTLDVKPNPVSEFSSDALSGCTPLQVNSACAVLSGQTISWLLDGMEVSNQAQYNHEFMNTDACDNEFFELQLVVESEFGCKDTSSTQIDVWPKPASDFVLDDDTSCYPDTTKSAVLIPGCFNNFTWQMNGEILVSNIEAIAIDFNQGINTISLEVENEWGCLDSSEQMFEVFPPTHLDMILQNSEGCEDLSVTFQALPGSISQWYWDFGNGMNSASDNPTVLYDDPGIYDVALYGIDQNNCSDSIRLESAVIVYPTPPANFIFTPEVGDIYNPEFDFYGNTDSSIVSWLWDFGDGSEGFGQHVFHQFATVDDYIISLIVTDLHGCVNSSIIEVGFDGEVLLYVPNAFTPAEQDGVNDAFGVVCGAPDLIESFELTIFNRWGQAIFTTQDITDRWDGNVLNGSYYAQDGAYPWRITYKVKGLNFERELNGHVIIIR